MNVLIVDDEIDLLELAKGFFEDEGMSTETAADVTSALELCRLKVFDVIITDAHMPSGGGIDFCRHLRHERSFKGMLILMSGDLERPGWKEQSGYDFAIAKPIDFLSLIERIKTSLSAPE